VCNDLVTDQEHAGVGLEPPHRNGSGAHPPMSPLPPGAYVVEDDEDGGGSRTLRIALIVGLVVLAGMWAYALVYSMTRRDPERLATAERDRVEQTCASAITRLRALPEVSDPPTLDSVLQRTKGENAELTTMVDSLRDIHIEHGDARTAYRAWLHSWDTLLASREHYEQQVQVDRGADLIIPVEDGTPITVRMNKYTDGKGLPSCNTTALGAEYVNALQNQ
jgi:hypothetical protein